jgi:UDPglucose 6-dehydrogenase
MNCESSELTKYAANAMLATRISFINQIALLADKVGADINQIKNGIAQDKRIGQYFLNAGIGYGGSCFPKDVKALVHMGIEHNQPMSLIKEVDVTNTKIRLHFIEKIINHYKNNNQKISQKKIGIWGLAFKPETDDIRYAPAIDVIQKLLEKEAIITVYDPIATNNIQKIFSNKITYATSAESILKTCDFLIILTEWKEFKNVTPEKFLHLNDKTIFDGRNCYDPSQMAIAGIQYYCIGRNIKSKEVFIQNQSQTKNYTYEEFNT